MRFAVTLLLAGACVGASALAASELAFRVALPVTAVLVAEAMISGFVARSLPGVAPLSFGFPLRFAIAVLDDACRALGWAVATVVTLISPEVVVIGGGVSLMGEALFFEPLRAQVRRFVFPPLADSVRIVPAELDEEGVVHGAVALAAAS